MKRRTFYSLFLILLLSAALLIPQGCGSSAGKNSTDPSDSVITQEDSSEMPGQSPESADQATPSGTGPDSADQSTPSDTSPEQSKEPFTMSDALFIGDSRTVGLSEYAGISEADFFATVGMSVYNIYDKPVSVPGTGKVTLEQLLSQKKYHKIYVMLGINEIGNDFSEIVKKYEKLVDYIQTYQPDATIFLQANLHVTQTRSDSGDYINNPAINRLNTAIAELADKENIYFLDANCLFDDSNGHLDKEKSEDNTHVYAKYYKEWGDWIIDQTKRLLEEGEH